MAAPKGNKNALENNGGRPRIFSSPKEMLEACLEYFEWADENPWIKNELIRGGDRAGQIMPVPTERPYTLIAMCHHIGIHEETFREYEKRIEFFGVTTYVRQKIYNQKYEGAAVGAFNANIIARDLGLKDSKDVTSDNKPIAMGPIILPLLIETYDEEE